MNSEVAVSALIEWLPLFALLVILIIMSRKRVQEQKERTKLLAEIKVLQAEIKTISSAMAATLVDIRQSLGGGKP